MSSCRSCHADLSSQARFCSACGTPVGAELMSSTRPDTAGLWPEGERRRLSLLFCDLVGSTTLGQRLDVEDYTEVIEAYVAQAAGAVEQYGGYVAQVQGDGIVAYFGFPSANEDDAERAVRAGLAIHEALSSAGGLGRAGVEVVARVGIHTGAVVVNEVGGARRELLALGDTANTAARVESMSPPGRVGISETTRRLVAHRFRITAGGEHSVKGIEEPITLFLVDGAAEDGGVRPAVEAGRVFVGREQLLSTFDETLESVGRGGRGASIAIVGEPGIGKSHFATVLLAGALERDCKVVTVSCSAIEQSAAFAPIVDMLGRLLGLAPTDDPDLAAASMQSSLSRHAIDLASTLPYLLQLSGLPASLDYPLPLLGPELQRARSMAAFEAVVVSVCAREPTVVLCEDIHWADQSTLEVLTMLAERARNCPLVLLVTSRPDFDLPAFTEIVTVDRLDIDASRAIVRARAGDAVVPDDVVDRLVARADGVPLFLEELTATVIETGDLETIPETLKDSLSARLDRLGPARALAQVERADRPRRRSVPAPGGRRYSGFGVRRLPRPTRLERDPRH